MRNVSKFRFARVLLPKRQHNNQMFRSEQESQFVQLFSQQFTPLSYQIMGRDMVSILNDIFNCLHQ